MAGSSTLSGFLTRYISATISQDHTPCNQNEASRYEQSAAKRESALFSAGISTEQPESVSSAWVKGVSELSLGATLMSIRRLRAIQYAIIDQSGFGMGGMMWNRNWSEILERA